MSENISASGAIKDEWLAGWNIPENEAESAWEAKCKMDARLAGYGNEIRGNEGVMPDIQPYKSMLTGEMIQSRSVHRVHLRDHNCVEIGNENVSTLPPPKKVDWKPEIIRRVYEAKEQQSR